MTDEKRFVICIDKSKEDVDLLLCKAYQVLGDPAGDDVGLIRVIDESGEDYLYPAKWFVPVELPQGAAETLAAIFEREHAAHA